MKIEIQDHPAEVIEVDAEILEQMKRRLNEESITGNATKLPMIERD